MNPAAKTMPKGLKGPDLASLQVKNTFIECMSESEDDMNISTSRIRQSSCPPPRTSLLLDTLALPYAHVSNWHAHKGEDASNEPDPLSFFSTVCSTVDAFTKTPLVSFEGLDGPQSDDDDESVASEPSPEPELSSEQNMLVEHQNRDAATLPSILAELPPCAHSDQDVPSHLSSELALAATPKATENVDDSCKHQLTEHVDTAASSSTENKPVQLDSADYATASDNTEGKPLRLDLADHVDPVGTPRAPVWPYDVQQAWAAVSVADASARHAAALGGAANAGSTRQQVPPEWAKVTTIMMRNLPNKVTQQILLTELNETGFEHTYDFVYLPIDQESNANRGYAFINFVAAEWAYKFMERFEGQKFGSYNSNKVVSVVPAKLQGYKANREYYSSVRIRHSDPALRPLFFQKQAAKTSQKTKALRNAITIDETAAQSHQAGSAQDSATAANGCHATQPKQDAKTKVPSFCPFCGGAAGAQYKFCRFCGGDLGSWFTA
jgi:hypothetical protein